MDKKNVVMATLRLFKALPAVKESTERTREAVAEFNAKSLHFGLFVDTNADVIGLSKSTQKEIMSKYGLSVEQMNQTFHKSFSAVADASDEQLVFQQMLHYLTTYGVESLGFEAGEICPVFIPAEKLNLPKDSDDIKIMVIGSISDDQIREKVKSLSEKNIAFSKNTLEDILLLVKEYNVALDVDAIANKELRVRVCVEFNKVPSNPQEFLRFLNYLILGDSLLIKDQNHLSSMACRSKGLYYSKADTDKANKALETYVQTHGFIPLASIFYQHKKLWLTMKNKKNASIINKIRRLADKYKKPAKIGILDRITSDASIKVTEVVEELKKVSLGKKVSLYNAMRYRQNCPESITYRIRNGKMFFKELDGSCPEALNSSKAEAIMEVIYESIVESVKEKAMGKTVYIPETVRYAFPTSEKDFVGGIPCGSVAHLGKTATIGVFWENIPVTKDMTKKALEYVARSSNRNELRVDLDFHMSSETADYGWDSYYRSNDKQVIFTGDMIDAPVGHGATECFYLGEDVNEAYSFNLNFYNTWAEAYPFSYKLILDASPADVFNREYILDKKTLLTSVSMELESSSQNIGIVKSNAEGNKDFIFYNLQTGTGITNRKDGDKRKMVIDSLALQCDTRLSLGEVLCRAGATVVTARPEEGEFVDLSLEAIAPTSIIELIM